MIQVLTGGFIQLKKVTTHFLEYVTDDLFVVGYGFINEGIKMLNIRGGFCRQKMAISEIPAVVRYINFYDDSY